MLLAGLDKVECKGEPVTAALSTNSLLGGVIFSSSSGSSFGFAALLGDTVCRAAQHSSHASVDQWLC
jgi:hypothetical protein